MCNVHCKNTSISIKPLLVINYFSNMNSVILYIHNLVNTLSFTASSVNNFCNSAQNLIYILTILIFTSKLDNYLLSIY